MVNNDNYEFAQVYSNNNNDTIDKVNQKLSLIRTARSNNKTVLSWDMLNNILNELDDKKSNLEQWHVNMEKYCNECGIKNIHLGRKMIITGLIPFTISILSKVLLEELSQKYGFNDSIVYKIAENVATDIIPKTVSVIGELHSIRTLKELKQEKEDNRAKSETIKQLLTQVSLLKK